MQHTAQKSSPQSSGQTALLVVTFRVLGVLRFVSHAEMLRVINRACVRAGLPMVYTQGYNPRPKLSLPLPRSVGVESDDELFSVRVRRPVAVGDDPARKLSDFEDSHVIETLTKQLPKDCSLTSAALVEPNHSIQPSAATYVFTLQSRFIDTALQTKIRSVLDSETIPLERTDEKGRKTKQIDARVYIQSIQLKESTLLVEYKITPAGTIRVEEIIRIMQLDPGQLAAPVRRTRVRWGHN